MTRVMVQIRSMYTNQKGKSYLKKREKKRQWVSQKFIPGALCVCLIVTFSTKSSKGKLEVEKTTVTYKWSILRGRSLSICRELGANEQRCHRHNKEKAWIAKQGEASMNKQNRLQTLKMFEHFQGLKSFWFYRTAGNIEFESRTQNFDVTLTRILIRLWMHVSECCRSK